MSKFITIIITIVLAMSLTACGGNTPTPAQSASEPSSSAVSVVEQTSSVEPASSESEESEASTAGESSSESASSSEPAVSPSDGWKVTDDLNEMTNILRTLTDDQFAAVLYDMQAGVKEPVVDYIIDISNDMFEEMGLRAEDNNITLKFPELYGRETETFEKVELPQNFREYFGKATSEACSTTILEELKNRGYVFVFKLWGTGDEAFIELVQDKMELS